MTQLRLNTGLLEFTHPRLQPHIGYFPSLVGNFLQRRGDVRSGSEREVRRSRIKCPKRTRADSRQAVRLVKA